MRWRCSSQRQRRKGTFVIGKLINAILDARDMANGVPLMPTHVASGSFLIFNGSYHEMTMHDGHSTPANAAYCIECGDKIGNVARDISRSAAIGGTRNLNNDLLEALLTRR